MEIAAEILTRFWQITEKKDKARLSKQRPADGIDGRFDIPYINDGETEHLLDVYFPENTKENLPAIIDIHGGGWMYGNKELNKTTATILPQEVSQSSTSTTPLLQKRPWMVRLGMFSPL